jgi:hypothetical protein
MFTSVLSGILFIIGFTTEAEEFIVFFSPSYLLPEVQGIYLYVIAAGRVAWLKFCQSVSKTAAYIKEGKPAHGYLALVVVVDNCSILHMTKLLLVLIVI